MSKVICEECGYADYIHDGGVTCKVESAIRKAERERIIKLLEGNLYYAPWEGIFPKDGGVAVDVEGIIALINGEQNSINSNIHTTVDNTINDTKDN